VILLRRAARAGLLAATLTLSLSSPASADEAPVPLAYRLALGPATVLGADAPFLAPVFDHYTRGIQQCGDFIVPESAASSDGWIASFVTVSDAAGDLLTLTWSDGHSLPEAARRCVRGLVSAMLFPPLSRDGFLYAHQVVWVLPDETSGLELPVRDEPPFSDVPWAELKPALEAVRPGFDACIEDAVDRGSPSRKMGRVELWAVVRPSGEVASVAASAANIPWTLESSCLATAATAARFAPHDPDGLRLARVVIAQRARYRPGVTLRPRPLPESAEDPPESGSGALPEIAASMGRAATKPRISYPDQAKSLGVEGMVRLRVLVDFDGRVVAAADPDCEAWHQASPGVRRDWWHRRLCIEAVDGHPTLVRTTIGAWAKIPWVPYETGGVVTRYWANVTTMYKLR